MKTHVCQTGLFLVRRTTVDLIDDEGRKVVKSDAMRSLS